MQTRTIQASATVGNFGPGFDAISLALAQGGDAVRLQSAASDRVYMDGPGAADLPSDWAHNVASVTIDALRKHTGIDRPLGLHITKGQAGGSGLGSSASSAGGAALAFHHAFPEADLQPRDLVAAAAQGEAAAAGLHHDDVAAVILGGLAVVCHPPLRLARVPPPMNLHLAVVVPDQRVPTQEMRALLPERVPRADAVHNLACLATLIHAFHQGDIATIGACLEDQIAQPHRLPRLSAAGAIRDAALAAGAHGITLSGSGPAMVAVCDGPEQADHVHDAMRDACTDLGLNAHAFSTPPQYEEPHATALSRM